MGWFTVIKEVLGLGGTLISGWAKRKQLEAETKVEITRMKAEAVIEQAKTAQQAEIEWDKQQAKNAQSSWKDEYWTIVLSIPAILCFIPGLSEYVAQGFDALKHTPEWYQYALLVAIAAAFGVRQLINYKKGVGK